MLYGYRAYVRDYGRGYIGTASRLQGHTKVSFEDLELEGKSATLPPLAGAAGVENRPGTCFLAFRRLGMV